MIGFYVIILIMWQVCYVCRLSVFKDCKSAKRFGLHYLNISAVSYSTCVPVLSTTYLHRTNCMSAV